MLNKLLSFLGLSEREETNAPTPKTGSIYHVNATKADCRYMQDHPSLNVEGITRIYTIQLIGSANVYDNAALLLNDYDKSVVIVSLGNMSFHSTHGGELAANKFYEWLNEHELLGKVSPAFMSSQDYDLASSALKLDMATIKLTGEALDENDVKTYFSNFNKWKKAGHWSA
jgi:hypothetical protein